MEVIAAAGTLRVMEAFTDAGSLASVVLGLVGVGRQRPVVPV